MRYMEITHKYILPVPDELDLEDPVFEMVTNRGVTIMEEFILSHASEARDLKSTWVMLPKIYSPVQSPQRRSMFGSEVGVVHPWDQDLWIFPEDHPLRGVEARYRMNYYANNDQIEKQNFAERIAIEEGLEDDED